MFSNDGLPWMHTVHAREQEDNHSFERRLLALGVNADQVEKVNEVVAEVHRATLKGINEVRVMVLDALERDRMTVEQLKKLDELRNGTAEALKKFVATESNPFKQVPSSRIDPPARRRWPRPR